MTDLIDLDTPAFDQVVRIDGGWRLHLTEPRDGRQSLIITDHQADLLAQLGEWTVATVDSLTQASPATRAAVAGRIATLEHRRLLWAVKRGDHGNVYALTRLGLTIVEAIGAAR